MVCVHFIHGALWTYFTTQVNQRNVNQAESSKHTEQEWDDLRRQVSDALQVTCKESERRGASKSNIPLWFYERGYVVASRSESNLVSFRNSAVLVVYASFPLIGNCHITFFVPTHTKGMLCIIRIPACIPLWLLSHRRFPSMWTHRSKICGWHDVLWWKNTKDRIRHNNMVE